MAAPYRGDVGHIRIRYWAAARVAAGVVEDVIAVDTTLSLEEIARRAVDLHPETTLGSVLQVCSALVGDRTVGSQDPSEVMVEPGESVEFLPPFAGG